MMLIVIMLLLLLLLLLSLLSLSLSLLLLLLLLLLSLVVVVGGCCFVVVVVVVVVLLSLGMRNTKISAISLLYSRLFSTNMISPSPPRNMTNLTMRATFATVSQRDHQCTCGSTLDTRESQALGTLQNSLVRISGWTSALKPQA